MSILFLKVNNKKTIKGKMIQVLYVQEMINK